MTLNFSTLDKINKTKTVYLFFLLLSLNSSGLVLDSILKAKNSNELKLSLKKEKNRALLKNLCEKQKQEHKIPLACYKLGEKTDFWCLNLKFENSSQLKEIEKALKSPFLSENCKNHLKSRKELLKYRERDFFLPELKNYFTDQKPFF